MENFLTNIWVEVYLKVFFGRDVSSHTFGGFVHFFVAVSIENCFVQTSLQRVCGGHVSSNIFLVQVLLKFVWYGFLFKEFLVKYTSSSKRFGLKWSWILFEKLVGIDFSSERFWSRSRLPRDFGKNVFRYFW